MNSVNYPSISLPELIGEVVASVRTDILTTLQAYDSVIQTIFYKYGNWKEIEETMREMGANQNYFDKKFPCILLIEDITISRGQANNLFGTAQNVNIIIANWTKSSYKSDERESVNFVPIIRPVYYSFLKNLTEHRGVSIYDERGARHNMIERKYWGMDNHTKNALGYHIDAIEITGLDIPLDWDYCNNIINANIT